MPLSIFGDVTSLLISRELFVSRASVMPHLTTYARLRQASPADITALKALHHLIASGHAFAGPSWRRLIGSRAARVTLALEGGLIVGACVKLHKPRSAMARILLMGVEPASRSRGVARLLLDTVIEQAQAEGAAVLVASVEPDRVGFIHLLNETGFARSGDDASRYRKSLWLGRRMPACNTIDLPYYPHAGDSHSGICALMMAMAGIDNGIILSERVESVLHHEVWRKNPKKAREQCLGLADAAAQRGFDTEIFGEGIGSVWPELLIGHLSRGHVPLVFAAFGRLHGNRPKRWLVVAGFDGYLFRLADPETRHICDCVTIGEMRAALDAEAPALVVVKPSS